MEKTKTSRRGAKAGTKTVDRATDRSAGLFASRFAEELDNWLAVEPGRKKRQFAEMCGADERALQRWETKGIRKAEVPAGGPLAMASAYFGIDPASWWDEELTRVPPAKVLSAMDAEFTSTILDFTRRTAYSSEGFREELKLLLKRHEKQG